MNLNTDMNMANKRFSIKDEFCVWNESGKTTLENEINEEYVLPDYLPDIRKILFVKTDMFIRLQRENGKLVHLMLHLTSQTP